MRVLPHGSSLVSRSTVAALRPSLTSVWPAVAGLAMLVAALAFIGPAAHLRNTPEVYGLLALAVAGLGVFMLGLSARVAERQRELERSNAALERALAELRESNRALDSAKRRSEATLAALPGRVLVLDAQGRIQGDFASQLEPSVPPVADASATFADLLRPVVSAQTLETAREHLSALFDPGRDGRALAAANPLQAVEAGVRDQEGLLHQRTLSFRFRRLRENGAIARVTVAFEDVSARVEAERIAHEGERRKAKHFDTLLGILYVDQTALDAFVSLAKDELSAIDHVLRGADMTAAGGSNMTNLRLRLESLSARAGAIKDNATLLGFEHFEKRAAAYQALLDDVQARPSLSGHDFLELIKAQSEFRGELEDLQALRFKLAALRRAAKLTSEADDELIGWLATRAHKLADELGREFEFEADGFDSRALPPEQRGVVKDVLSELVRNALLHGVEAPIEREIAGKPRAAVLEVRPLHDVGSDAFGFAFRDDGRGLDPARIRERAVKLGMLDAQQAERLDDSDAAGLIFAPGFTTAQDAHGTPARGQGLTTLKARVVDACGGTIGLDAESDAFTEFTIVLPLATKRPGFFRR